MVAAGLTYIYDFHFNFACFQLVACNVVHLFKRQTRDAFLAVKIRKEGFRKVFKPLNASVALI